MASIKIETVDFRHPDYVLNEDRWTLIDDMCDSTNLQGHLVYMNPDDVSTENKTFNEQVFHRSVFYALAGYTARGLIGKAFSKEPKVEVPTVLDYTDTNIDGAGVSLIQQSQDALKEVIRKGRGGLLIDMAANEDGSEFSKEDLQSNFATVSLYRADQITNWRTIQIGSQIVTSQVVLALSEAMDGEDGFSFENVDIRIELKLSQANITDATGTSVTQWVYSMTEWRRDPNNKDKWIASAPVFPTDAAGAFLDRIPFVFLGSESNTPSVDAAPMYDLSIINRGHYNNSAVYEDSVFTVGQAQPWMSGITQELIDLFKANNMYIGSRRLMGVPTGEQFAFAQAKPNTLAREAMTDKVISAISLGAMIIQPGGVAKTADQSSGERATQHSVLSLSVSNVSEGYKDALAWMVRFMTSSDVEAIFELNQEFVDHNVEPNELREMIAGFLSNAIPMSDYHAWLKKKRLTDPDKEVEEWAAELEPQESLGLDDEV
tara:strand:+ start:30224 stop:31690 length:1467 start_codon:yes stop_codon:yes gene_type:complete